MTLRSCREIRNQLAALVAVAGSVLATTTLVLEARAAKAQESAPGAEIAVESPSEMVQETAQPTGYLNEFAKITTRDGAVQVNWEDVNLSGHVTVPEEEVATARSAILKDFEAR